MNNNQLTLSMPAMKNPAKNAVTNLMTSYIYYYY